MTLEKEEIEVKCLKVYGGTDFFFHFGITNHWVLIMIIQHPWISGSSLCINHKTTFSAFAGWDRCGRRWSDQLWRVLHHDVHKVLRGHKGLQGKVRSGEASMSAKQSLFHLNTLQCPGYVLHSMNIFIYTQSESKLPTNITVRRCRSGGFLAVQDSSIGDLVTHSVSEWVSESVSQVTFDFCDNDKTFERLLRDFWETFERLLRDF